jgi:prepilin-type processing-associated H-X9-DG protein
MIAIGETGSGIASDTLLNPNADLHTPDEGSWLDKAWLPSDRHRGRANMLFCDGHVETAHQARWIEKTDRARRRWNNDNEPHRETW